MTRDRCGPRQKYVEAIPAKAADGRQIVDTRRASSSYLAVDRWRLPYDSPCRDVSKVQRGLQVRIICRGAERDWQSNQLAFSGRRHGDHAAGTTMSLIRRR